MIVRHIRAAAAIAAAALVCSSCSFSPISHRIKVGEEPFIVFVGEGIDHHTDLFAAPAGGVLVSQITFTPLIEQDPRLTPMGDVVAFLRMRDSLPQTPRDVVMMNLVSGGEMTAKLPAGAGRPIALAWSADAGTLYIQTDLGLWQTPAPPRPPAAVPVTSSNSATADSALATWVGEPRLARIVPCPTGGLCVVGIKGDTAALAPHGHDAIHWGADSVGWFEGNGMTVRSLGPGRERRVSWQDSPGNPRQGTYAPGPTTTP